MLMPITTTNGLSLVGQGGNIVADGAALVTLLVEPDRRRIAVLVEVGHLQAAGGGQPGARAQKEPQNRAIAVVEHGIASRQSDELAGAGGPTAPAFLPTDRWPRER